MCLSTVFQAKYAIFLQNSSKNVHFDSNFEDFSWNFAHFFLENSPCCRAKSQRYFCRICEYPILQLHVSLAILSLEVQWWYFWNLQDRNRKKGLRFFSHISSVWGDIEYFRDDCYFDTFLAENEHLKSASCKFSTRDTSILWGCIYLRKTRDQKISGNQNLEKTWKNGKNTKNYGFWMIWARVG